jgi:signal transduction histidine kinase
LRGCAGIDPALYDNADGLRSRSLALSQSQLAQDGRDRIWIATGTALFRIDGFPGAAAPAAPRALVLGVTARGERYAGNRPVQLAAGVHDLQFDYTAPVLDTPERVRFRYRLVGYDNVWQYAGERRQAFYTGLDPGRYQFELAASQGNSGWSGASAPLAVEIAPAWYQTWWFRSLSMLALLIVLTCLHRLRVRRLTRRVREQADTRQQERERIARDLHDTVLQTNFALLLQVRAVAATAADAAVGQQLSTIVSRAQATLAEGRDKVAGLRAQQEPAPPFTVALEQLADRLLDGSGVALHCSGHGRPWPFHDDVARECQAIVAEALANVRQHAQARHAWLDVRYGWRSCTIAVSDDGIGIAGEFLAGRAGHWGLAGMRERAALIAARLDVAGGSAGTTVRVRLRRRQAGRG